jgi:Ca2+-binding RTX toxin-like protein
VSCRGPIRLAGAALLALILAALTSAFAAANTVPATGLDIVSAPITANSLKPAACAALNLTSVVIATSGGNITGGAGSSLILGSPQGDRIRGQGGDDCILGGGGDDELRGQNGDDVLIGGPGASELDGGNGTDQCYSVGFVLFYRSCELIGPP